MQGRLIVFDVTGIQLQFSSGVKSRISKVTDMARTCHGDQLSLIKYSFVANHGFKSQLLFHEITTEYNENINTVHQMTQIVKICDLSIAHPESWCLTSYLDENCNLSEYNVMDALSLTLRTEE